MESSARSYRYYADLKFLTLLLLASWCQSLDVGDIICVQGYVMDYYCIEREYLLDRSDVRTLEGPQLHSVHCLIEEAPCRIGPYEILIDPVPPATLYTRGYQLDSTTQEEVIQLADSIGVCDTCSPNGFLRVGMRVGFEAEVLDLGTDTRPPIVTATNTVEYVDIVTDYCPTPPPTPAPTQGGLNAPTPAPTPAPMGSLPVSQANTSAPMGSLPVSQPTTSAPVPFVQAPSAISSRPTVARSSVDSDRNVTSNGRLNAFQCVSIVTILLMVLTCSSLK